MVDKESKRAQVVRAPTSNTSDSTKMLSYSVRWNISYQHLLCFVQREGHVRNMVSTREPPHVTPLIEKLYSVIDVNWGHPIAIEMNPE